MKQIKYLIGTACVTLALSSCDIDNVRNLGETSTENFPVTEEDANAVLAGIYENLNAVHAYPQESNLYMNQLASDDCFGGGGENDKLMQSLDLFLNYGASVTMDFWNQRYEGLNRANTLIAALPNLSFSDDVKNRLMGECLFLRAFYQFDLASMYGNVPLMTEPTGDIVTPGEVSTLYGQMLQDLRDACDLMPDQNNINQLIGHVDKYAAEALLARIWLFYTGFYCNGETIADLTSSNYSPLTSVELPDGTTLTKDQVKNYIDDCVKNSGYDLVPDFRNLWAYTNRFTVEDWDYTAGQGLKWVEDDNGAGTNTNPESMFAIKFNKLADWSTTIGYGNGIALHMGLRAADSNWAGNFPIGAGWGAGPVAPNLVQDWVSIEPDDPRRDATILDLNTLPDHNWGGGDTYMQETDYYALKWSPFQAKDPETGNLWCCFENLMYGTEGWPQGSGNLQLNNIHDLVLIRFADVLLMHSELWENADGMNRVRARAGLPATTYSLENLQNERRWELACEGIRFNDIRRWHIAADALDRQQGQKIWVGAHVATVNNAQNGGYKARYMATAGFQKVPDQAVTIGSMPQNPGWTGADSEFMAWTMAN